MICSLLHKRIYADWLAKILVQCINEVNFLAVTKAEYNKMAQQRSGNSPLLKNMFWAFVIGGLICTIGQIIFEVYSYYGLNVTDASGATSISLIFLGAFLTGLKLYDKVAKHAGAGTIVPITGFANAIVSPALEYKSEGFILGMSAQMFTVAGPVLVFGVSASIIYGFIIWLFRIY